MFQCRIEEAVAPGWGPIQPGAALCRGAWELAVMKEFMRVAFEAVETPALLLDLDVVARNIARFQGVADRIGLKVRPYVKTHRLAEVARMQLVSGAIGVSCQKVSEAEAMLTACPGITDILISCNIVGAEKLDRLRLLAQRVRLSVVADSPTIVDGLSLAFANSPAPLHVLVECNTGAGHCGVDTPAAAAELARRIEVSPGLKFEGLLTCPPADAAGAVQVFMTRTIALLAQDGIEVPAVSSGGSPSIMQAGAAPVVTEYRPGPYTCNDRSLVARGVCGWGDCALTVLATVVSVSAGNRAIVDAGSNALSSMLLASRGPGHGHVLGRPDIVIDDLSEEHGRLVSQGPIRLVVGDRVQIVPNSACMVTNLFDEVTAYRSGAPLRQLKVSARGTVF